MVFPGAQPKMSQGLKPIRWWVGIVRAKARTYLRNNRNGKSKCNSNAGLGSVTG
jgi:hypothetical protein